MRGYVNGRGRGTESAQESIALRGNRLEDLYGPSRTGIGVPALGAALQFAPVKGGVKLDHRGGGRVDQFTGSWGFGLRDLRGRLERRPATRVAGRV